MIRKEQSSTIASWSLREKCSSGVIGQASARLRVDLSQRLLASTVSLQGHKWTLPL